MHLCVNTPVFMFTLSKILLHQYLCLAVIVYRNLSVFYIDTVYHYDYIDFSTRNENSFEFKS